MPNTVQRWFERIVTMDGKLQGRERNKRAVVFLMHTAIVFVAAPVLPFTPAAPGVLVAVLTLLCLQCLLLLCLCVLRLPLPPALLLLSSAALGCVIMLLDLHQQTISRKPVWPLFILIGDYVLALRLGRRISLGLAGAFLLWILLSTAETGLRFGLFDMPGTVGAAYRRERAWEVCDCDNPPCVVRGYSVALDMMMNAFVLCASFLTTRSFAVQAEKEQAAMARTIETVEAIAQLLAGYDVDTVAEMLQEAEAEGRLPAAMHEALHCLEQNLRAYRPYLPKSCLPVGDVTDSESTNASNESDTSDCDANLTAIQESLSASKMGVLKSTRASALVINTYATMEYLDRDPRAYSEHFEHVLSTVMYTVEARRGLVDVFIGECILASFNTSRMCMTHAPAAANAAKQIIRTVGKGIALDITMRINIGAAMGRVPCGDMGCAEMRRFNLLGTLPMLACGMERAARAFGIDILCNTAMQRDVEHEQVLLLVPRLVRVLKLTVADNQSMVNSGDTSHVFEVATHAEDSVAASEEWMYQVGKVEGQYLSYNTAMRAFLEDGDYDNALAHAGEHEAAVSVRIRLLSDPTVLLVYV